jgi:hydrogenase expression/formation protein HypE
MSARRKAGPSEPERISLEVGSGGLLMRRLIDRHIMPALGNRYLVGLPDASHLPGGIALTTDGFTVDPIFFPGGDIGTLAVNGTVNDLVVSGARPEYLSLSLILEEGLPLADLERVLASIRKASLRAKVRVVTGDTKVVRRGQADKLYVTTAGVGRVVGRPSAARVRPGDKIILTGPLGEHSLAVMLARGEFGLASRVKSDCAPLNFLLPLWRAGALWMRDVTRGGLATILSELAERLPWPVHLDEGRIPVSSPVRGATELLGIDPLYLACEGRAVIVAPRKRAARFLARLRSHPQGRKAAIIGEVSGADGRPGELLLATPAGGLRLLEPLTSEILPRIC